MYDKIHYKLKKKKNWETNTFTFKEKGDTNMCFQIYM